MHLFNLENNGNPSAGNENRFAVVIPVYNHGASIENVIVETLKLGLPVFVVDDGSTDDTYERVSRFKEIHILRHSRNLGKGAAMTTGFIEAARIADWAVTIDADGQHNPRDAKNLIKTARRSRRSFIIGHRTGMDGPNVLWTSRYGRKFSNFWVRISGGPLISDSQSGFRIYPLPEVSDWGVKSKRFEFEVEAIVRAHLKGVPVIETPVGVNYLPPGKRISHFRPGPDFIRNAKTFTRLIIQRILRYS